MTTTEHQQDSRSKTPGDQYVRLGRMLIVGGTLALLLFIATSGFVLWRLQQQAEQRATLSALAGADVAEQWFTDQLHHFASLSPREVEAQGRENPGGPLPLSEPLWYALVLASPDGEPIVRLGPKQGLPARWTLPPDRAPLTAGAPMRDEVGGRWLVPLFRAVSEGRYLVGVLDQRGFEAMHDHLHPRGGGSLSLFSSTGTLLLREPFGDRLIGRDFSAGPLFTEVLPAAASGVGWAPVETDGVRRLVAHRALPDYPFVITVGLDANMILAPARREIIASALVLAVIFIFMGVLVRLLMRQYREAAQAHRALREAEARLRDMAAHDSLTGALNRRVILERASEEMQRYRRHHRPFALLMIDLDHFKEVNDHHGHLVGDSALLGIASLCQELLRPIDQFGRYGGEEFLVVLPESDTAAAKRVADRLREAVAGLAFETGEEPVHLTLSVGVAVVSEETGSLNELIDSADRALYRAKRNGRDQVCAQSDAAT